MIGGAGIGRVTTSAKVITGIRKMTKEISKTEILKCIYLKPDRIEGVHCNVCGKTMTNDQINRCCLGFTAIYLDGDFLAQLMYGQGIHNATVISCNYEEVMKAYPVFITDGAF